MIENHSVEFQGTTYSVGEIVDVEYPSEGDRWGRSFIGTIVRFLGSNFARVEDRSNGERHNVPLWKLKPLSRTNPTEGRGRFASARSKVHAYIENHPPPSRAWSPSQGKVVAINWEPGDPAPIGIPAFARWYAKFQKVVGRAYFNPADKQGGIMNGMRNPSRRTEEPIGKWVLIGGYGKLGDQNWGFDPSKVEANKWLREARKHIGEKVLLTGGGGYGARTAKLEGVFLKKRVDRPGVEVRLRMDEPIGGMRIFTPWLGSWQISVWEGKKFARGNPKRGPWKRATDEWDAWQQAAVDEFMEMQKHHPVWRTREDIEVTEAGDVFVHAGGAYPLIFKNKVAPYPPWAESRSNPIERGAMVCDYCGKRKEGVGFYVGASRPDDKGWTMHEGTGKTSCPDCHEKGTAEGQAAIDRHVRGHSRSTRHNPDEIRRLGPGKFSTVIDELFWSLSLDGGPDEQLGESDAFGWYGKMAIDPSIIDGLNRVAKDADEEPLNEAEREFVLSQAGAILSEDSQGFVDVEFYRTEGKLERAWSDLETEYERFETEAGEEGS